MKPAPRTLGALAAGWLASAVPQLLTYLEAVEDGTEAFSWLTIVRGAVLSIVSALTAYLALRSRAPGEMPAPDKPIDLPPDPSPARDALHRARLPRTPTIADAPNHFAPEEFECRGMACDCVSPPMDQRLMDVLNRDVRDVFGPTIITSGYRCAVHNAEVGGARDSEHLRARAADIRVVGADPQEVYDYLDARYPDSLGLGLYASFVHVDTRPGEPARWTGPGMAAA